MNEQELAYELMSLDPCRDSKKRIESELKFLSQFPIVTNPNDIPPHLRWRIVTALRFPIRHEDKLTEESMRTFASCMGEIYKVQHEGREYFVCGRRLRQNGRGCCLECISHTFYGSLALEPRWIEEFVQEIRKRKRLARANLEYNAYLASKREESRSQHTQKQSS